MSSRSCPGYWWTFPPARSTIDPAQGVRRLVFSITKRVAYDISRRERLRTHPELDERVVGATEGVDGVKEWEAWQVRMAIERLSEDERTIVRLQHFEGFTHTEIAERLGVPVGTIKSRSHRAHQRLVTLLRRLKEVE